VFKLRQPFRCAFVQIPRVIAKTRQHNFAPPRQRKDLRPVAFASAVDDHADDARLFTSPQEFILPPRETVVLEVVVGIVQFHKQFKFLRLNCNQPGSVPPTARELPAYLTLYIHLSKFPDSLPYLGQCIAAVGRQMLGDAQGS
jgi:hypothetical protein